MRLAYQALLGGYSPGRPPLAARLRLDIPGSAGLGASAACAVALVRAADEALGIERDASAIASASLPWEKVYHGNPSGIDSALAASGKIALFRRGESLTK